MLAKLATELPRGRRLALRAEVGRLPRDRRSATATASTSRAATCKPLDRYFPELAAPLRASLPERCVVDGEIVIAGARRARLRRAAAAPPPGRVARREARRARRRRRSSPSTCSPRATRTCARGRRPSAARGSRARSRGAAGRVHLTPCTRDRARRRGLVPPLRGRRARRRRSPSTRARPTSPASASMVKVKHARTADCVVAGFRWHKNGPGDAGRLAAARPLRRRGRAAPRRRDVVVHDGDARRQLAQELAPLREDALDGHPWREWAEAAERRARACPGGQSRWNAGKDLSWEPLRLERVCEVAYDHLQGDRFRHAANFLRWRPDKPPADCRYDQLEVTPPAELARDLREPAESHAGPRVSLDAVAVEAARVVVGIERLLRRPQRLGHVLEVHADAGPGRGAPAHRVDEHVGGLRDARPPRGGAPSSARGRRARPPSCARAADLDERLRRDAAAAGAGSRLPARRRHARRLARLLRVVRRPRRVAQALRLLRARTAPAAARASTGARRSPRAGRRSPRSARASCAA